MDRARPARNDPEVHDRIAVEVDEPGLDAVPVERRARPGADELDEVRGRPYDMGPRGRLVRREDREVERGCREGVERVSACRRGEEKRRCERDDGEGDEGEASECDPGLPERATAKPDQSELAVTRSSSATRTSSALSHQTPSSKPLPVLPSRVETPDHPGFLQIDREASERGLRSPEGPATRGRCRGPGRSRARSG
jgi:hypothetical protein